MIKRHVSLIPKKQVDDIGCRDPKKIKKIHIYDPTRRSAVKTMQ